MTVSQTGLSLEHRDLIGEISNISMGGAATALSALLRRRVEITTPTVEVVTWDGLDPATLAEFVAVRITYTAGLEGNTYLLVREPDAARIVDLMMGGDGSAPRSIDPAMLLSGVAEAMNQMMGSAATAMAEFLAVTVQISPPTAFPLRSGDDLAVLRGEGDPVIRVSFRMVVEGLLETTFYQICPAWFVPQLAQMSAAAAARLVSAVPSPAPVPTPSQPAPADPRDAHATLPTRDGPVARPVEFGPLSPRTGRSTDRNIELLLDVSLLVTVELGRTRMRIRDVLGLGSGAVVELDRLAGEPVDLYLNDRLFARGEVVVIEESFGVRITEILSPEARVQALATRSLAGVAP